LRLVRVEWETDGEAPGLPDEVEIPKEIDDEGISDFLSDTYGWLVLGWERVEGWSSLSEEDRKTWLEKARSDYGTDNGIEFDDDAVVSVSNDGGAYVAAWVWVADPEGGDDD